MHWTQPDLRLTAVQHRDTAAVPVEAISTVSCSLIRPTALYAVTDTHSGGSRLVGRAQQPTCDALHNATRHLALRCRVKRKAVLYVLLCLVFSGFKASLKRECAFYGLCLHTLRHNWGLQGALLCWKLGCRGGEESSRFASALQEKQILETHSFPANNVCACTWPSCLALCPPTVCTLLSLPVSLLNPVGQKI